MGDVPKRVEKNEKDRETRRMIEDSSFGDTSKGEDVEIVDLGEMDQ